jgi:hypothetical protein
VFLRSKIIFILFVFFREVTGDDIGEFKSFITSSPMGSHCFILTPIRRDFNFNVVSEAKGQCFRITSDGQLEPLWETKGWYGIPVLLSDDGVHLACVNSWPDEIELKPDTVGIRFYRNGECFKSIKIVELIDAEESLIITSSHYQWLDPSSWRCRLVGDSLFVKTVESNLFKFDIRTGLLEEKIKAP